MKTLNSGKLQTASRLTASNYDYLSILK